MMQSLVECLLGIRSAFVLLTRVPFGNGALHRPDLGAKWALAHLPLVGAFIGLIGAAVWTLAIPLEADIRAWLVIAALLLLTGALHEDGLADTADALGGAFSRERLFEILKDSRVGSYGALALVVTLGLRAALLSRLLAETCWIIVLSQTVSRLTPVLLQCRMPYVSPKATSRSYQVARSQKRHSAIACGWALLVCTVVAYFGHVSVPRLLFGLGMQVAVASWLAFRFKQRVGGVTGDLLGAAQQFSELAFLLGLARW